MTKAKANELYQRIINGEVDDYFKHLSSGDFQRLSKAIADDDVDTMSRLLASNLKKSKAGFSTPLESGSYDAEVRELANRILSRETKRMEKEGLIRFVEKEPQVKPVIFPSKEQKIQKKFEKPVSINRGIRQKSYRRTLPRKFTPKEIKFLKRRSEMTGGQVYKQYLELFGRTRTKRSVTTKFFRLKV